jgi:predicted Zn-dependent protease
MSALPRANDECDVDIETSDCRQAGRFLSKDECVALVKKVAGFAVGGGTTGFTLETWWTGSISWKHNEIRMSTDVRDHTVHSNRSIRGASGSAATNQINDTSLEAAVRRAERLLIQDSEDADLALNKWYVEPYDTPVLWFDRTYNLGAIERADVVRKMITPAREAGMLSAGFLQVSGHGRSFMTSDGMAIYYPYTLAQYTVTVRDPQGTGSGWAGVDWNDWGRIDTERLSAIALEKCLASRNPVAVEPGRYVTILEPQAVADFVDPLFGNEMLDRLQTEQKRPVEYPFSEEKRGETKIGQRVIDERLTITSDPIDPDCGFVPIGPYSPRTVYHPVTWIDRGVLKELAYDREYALRLMLKNTGLPTSNAFHMRGDREPTSMEENVLHELLGDRPYPDPPVRERQQLIGVVPKHRGKRIPIPLPDPRDPLVADTLRRHYVRRIRDRLSTLAHAMAPSSRGYLRSSFFRTSVGLGPRMHKRTCVPRSPMGTQRATLEGMAILRKSHSSALPLTGVLISYHYCDSHQGHPGASHSLTHLLRSERRCGCRLRDRTRRSGSRRS